MIVELDLPEDDVCWLDSQATALGITRDELVRRALTSYRAACEQDHGLDGDPLKEPKP